MRSLLVIFSLSLALSACGSAIPGEDDEIYVLQCEAGGFESYRDESPGRWYYQAEFSLWSDLHGRRYHHINGEACSVTILPPEVRWARRNVR
jgi:hypothetical protein